MLEKVTKAEILLKLNDYIDVVGSANRASLTLNVSGATLSNMRALKWDSISDDLWREVARGIGMKLEKRWMHAETAPFIALRDTCELSRSLALTFGVICKPGGGKTHTLDVIRTTWPNVLYYKCHSDTSAKDIYSGLIKSAGKLAVVGTAKVLLAKLKCIVQKMDKPIIIIDELEKTKRSVFTRIVDIYNALEENAGTILLGTEFFKKRLEEGVRNVYPLHYECMSRISKFIDIPHPSANDAAIVLRVNGIIDPDKITPIVNDSRDIFQKIDLRRVKRLALAEKL